MPLRYDSTLRTFEAGGSRSTVAAAVVAVALLALWGLWVTTSRVDVYEVSLEARIEVDSAPRAVHSPVSGIVEEALLELGREVQSGDVLVRLEDAHEQLEVTRRASRAQELEAQSRSRTLELRSEQSAYELDRQAAESEQVEHEVNRQRLAERLASAQRDFERQSGLRREQVISEAELDRARAALTEAELELQKVEATAARRRRATARDLEDRRTRIARLRGELTELEAMRGAVDAEVTAGRLAADRLVIRASVAGRLGDVQPLSKGGFVEAGQVLGTLIPEGAPVVVAYFSPAATGRVQVGDAALLHLEGYPSTQFGALPATVARVASEPQDRRLRVELSLVDGGLAGEIPTAHGLPGRLEVRVERVRPLDLLLRTAGRGLRPTPSPGRSEAATG